jgi:hypothetical protein
MRLIEEQKLVRVELVMLVFVVLAGVGIQYCTFKAEEHRAKLLDNMSNIGLTENVRISQKVSSLRYLLSAYADANVEVNSDELDGTRSLDSELAKIANDYLAGRITKIDYFNKLSLRHNEKSKELHKMYLLLLKEKSELLQNPP